MQSIKVSQELKENNPVLFRGDALGAIVQKNFPYEFILQNRRFQNYKDRTDLHAGHGWQITARPPLLENQKYTGKIIEVSGVYTFEIIDLTQAEIDANLANLQDSEDEAEEQSNEQAGVDLIRRWRKRARRRTKDGRLSLEDFKTLRKLFRDVFLYLKNGDFDIALDELNSGAFSGPFNNNINREINFLVSRITDFINTDFQRQ